MIDRLKNLFNPEKIPDPGSGIETLLQDLDDAIISISAQYERISEQEQELTEMLAGYRQQHHETIEEAKVALQKSDQLKSEKLYHESEIVRKQIDQYTGIVRNIRQTGQKLLKQKNQFSVTRDQLKIKQSLGEAHLDASRLNADLSEQLMILDETGELSHFDELIREASSKSEAIEAIRGNEALLEDLKDEPESHAIEHLQELVIEDKEEKLRASQHNQQLLIEKVFGKLTPSEDPAVMKNKKTLLDKLKNHTVAADDREKNVNEFFTDKPEKASSTDREDRIRNFFKNENQPADNKKAMINQFFKKKQ